MMALRIGSRQGGAISGRGFPVFGSRGELRPGFRVEGRGGRLPGVEAGDHPRI